MAYAGNSVNTQAALANYINASNAAVQARQHFGQTIADGVSNAIKTGLTTYQIGKEAEQGDRKVAAMESEVASQNAVREQQTRGLKLENDNYDENNKTKLDYIKSQTALNNSQVAQDAGKAVLGRTAATFLSQRDENGKTYAGKAMAEIMPSYIQNFASGKVAAQPNTQQNQNPPYNGIGGQTIGQSNYGNNDETMSRVGSRTGRY